MLPHPDTSWAAGPDLAAPPAPVGPHDAVTSWLRKSDCPVLNMTHIECWHNHPQIFLEGESPTDMCLWAVP